MEFLLAVIERFIYPSKNGFFITLIALCLCMLVPVASIRNSGATSEDNANELPFCKPTTTYFQSRPLLVVSTLDGHVTALDTIDGSVLWSLDTEPGALLESTISNHEYTNQGKWSRLVPSLNGDLFTFDGESMEAVPISADSLLSNTLKLSDDTVIAGGKEINVYGIKRDTGELVYSCGIEKCKHVDDVIQHSNDDILLVRRLTRTVRALSVNSGTEKWNYSVGQHEVKMAATLKDEGCHKQGDDADVDSQFEERVERQNRQLNDFHIRFKSTDGEVFVFNNKLQLELIWKHKFSSPIVQAWNLTDKTVQTFDLFECQYNPVMSNTGETGTNTLPMLFVGLYKQQLYVMQSKKIVDSLPFEWRTLGVELPPAPPRVTWKPYLITSHSRTPIIVGRLPAADDALISRVESDSEKTALVMSNNGVEYPYDSGFYLFPVHNVNMHEEKTKEQLFAEDESIDQIIVSLWYWWKEVLLISVTFAIALNICIVKIYRLRRKCMPLTKHEVIVELITNKSDPCLRKELSTPSTNSSVSQMGTPPVEFVSRYLTDFEPLETLGKGGFGVVFRARNKIDDCEYALKRISMPTNQDSKERILREVKTLAKLDHVGIVRYYNSWLECPPADWQTMMDQNMNTGHILTPTSSLTVDELQKIYNTHTKDRGDNRQTTDTSQHSPELRNGIRKSTVRSRRNRKICDTLNSADNFENTTSSHSEFNFAAKANDTTGDSFIVFEGSNSRSVAEDESSRRGDESPLTIDLVNEKSDVKSSDSHPTATDTGTSFEKRSKDGKSIVLKFPNWPPPTKTLLYIQMQLCRKDSLKDWLSENKDCRNKLEVLDIFYQIVGAVEYVHDQGLMHRDLKPSNIFFALDGSVKVGDFGLVTNMAQNLKNEDGEDGVSGSSSIRHTNQVGTTLYMSPEQIAGEMYDHKVDIFSLGLVFFELLVPFTTTMERIRTMNAARALKFSPDFIEDSQSEHNLVKQMLEHDPRLRPCASEILNHPLLENFQVKPDRMRRGTRHRSGSRTYSMSSSGSGQGSSGNDIYNF